LKSIQYFSI